MDIDKKLHDRGFQLEEIGGGLRQYVSEVDDSCTQRLATEDGQEVMNESEPVVLTHEEDGQDLYRRQFPNLNEFLAWHDVAEYVLPENGDGPVANGWVIV